MLPTLRRNTLWIRGRQIRKACGAGLLGRLGAHRVSTRGGHTGWAHGADTQGGHTGRARRVDTGGGHPSHPGPRAPGPGAMSCALQSTGNRTQRARSCTHLALSLCWYSDNSGWGLLILSSISQERKDAVTDPAHSLFSSNICS